MLRVPRIDGLSFGFHGTSADDCIIDTAARDSSSGSVFQHSRVFVPIECDQSETLPDISQKQQCGPLYAAGFVPAALLLSGVPLRLHLLVARRRA
jgi:hypothetical protein